MEKGVGGTSFRKIDFFQVFSDVMVIKDQLFLGVNLQIQAIWPYYFWNTPLKMGFKSVHHPILWGVYPEVLMALAQNSWEKSISLNRLGEKSQKPYFKTGIFKTEIKHGFGDFSPNLFNKIEFSHLIWASVTKTSG